jgi:peptidyl-prolyl cis-trans isomerase SurA
MKKFIVAVVLCFSSLIYSQEVLDRIVAVVDNEVVLQSELDFQTQLFAQQRKIDPKAPGLKSQVLNMLVEDKLLYAQANLDSIQVTEDEMKRQIESRMAQIIQQYGSREKVEQLYGMGIEKIKRELRDDVKKEIMIYRLQEKKFGILEATRREVEEFFAKYKDSLGVIPEKMKISHIFKNPKTSESSKLRSKMIAQKLLDSIKGGADFATLAKENSEDPGSAAHGGDLGFVKRGVFYPQFEAAAFELTTNELSPVIESPVGYHIIQLLEKRGDAIHCRHILIKIKADEEADLKTIELLNDVRDSVIRFKLPFTEMAKKYSDDKETAAFGGLLGTFYQNQIDKNLLEIVSKLKEGEISFPRRVDYSSNVYGYHIVYLQKKIAQHLPDINIDYDEVKRLAEEYKKQKLYGEWMAEIKKKIFWEIRL